MRANTIRVVLVASAVLWVFAMLGARAGSVSPGLQKLREDRDKKMEQIRQEQEKARQERLAKEEADGQAEYAKQKYAAQQKRESERSALYNENPKRFFDSYVKDTLALVGENGIEEPQEISGRVVQIPSRDLLLLKTRDSEELVAVQGYDTSKLVDDATTACRVVSAGQFRYVNVLGATKTIHKFVAPHIIT